MSGNACNGENGERSPGAGNSNRPFEMVIIHYLRH